MSAPFTSAQPPAFPPGSLFSGPTPAVEVVRSTRRRKTVSARLVGGVVRVSIPARMSKAEEERWVVEMLRRFERRRLSGEVDLEERAAKLAARFGLRTPSSIRWVDNQAFRWGSCTPGQGTVRISSQLAKEPGWVLDYVIVHELAHLDVSGHNRAFWDVVARYPLAERARGFLIARGLDNADGTGDEAEPSGFDVGPGFDGEFP